MSVADEIAKLVALRDAGDLTEDEFLEQKRRLLAGQSVASTDPVPAPTTAATPGVKTGMGTGMKIFLGLLAAFGLFLAFGAYEANKPGAEERYRASQAIASCWSEHDRKSLDAGTKRFVAGSCEQMERDYRQKYGRNP